LDTDLNVIMSVYLANIHVQFSANYVQMF